MRRAIVLLTVVAALAVTGAAAAVVVDETRQVVITEFGRPVRTITEASLHFKVPFIQVAHHFERRLMEYDAASKAVITTDKKTLLVDNYAQWRIVDPLRFLQTVVNEAGAQSRLDDIIYSELRVELGRYTLSQIVATEREVIMGAVTRRTDEKAREFGVEVVDVRIKRADLPPENEAAVYDRMRAERERQALQYRSEGAEEAIKIRAQTDKERTIILAEAYREAQTIRGEGDAVAARIYAQAFNQDREFYSLVRTLEAYQETLQGDKVLILGPDSEFLRYFSGTR